MGTTAGRKPRQCAMGGHQDGCEAGFSAKPKSQLACRHAALRCLLRHLPQFRMPFLAARPIKVTRPTWA